MDFAGHQLLHQGCDAPLPVVAEFVAQQLLGRSQEALFRYLLLPLEKVAGKVRRMPDEYIDRTTYGVTGAFLDYARPLLGGPLPRFGRLSLEDLG